MLLHDTKQSIFASIGVNMLGLRRIRVLELELRPWPDISDKFSKQQDILNGVLLEDLSWEMKTQKG